MPQDAFTLRYLCIELNNIFSGGKVNRITQPSNDEIILTLFTGKRTEKLLLNVNPAMPRISIINEDRESPLTAPNFCMLLRKHLLNATLNKIELIGFDRIVKISFTSSAEFVDSVNKDLYVELMGRYSNVVLTENNRILGGNRGINMFDDGVRPLIVGREYVFPPVQEKKLPSDESLIELFSNNDSTEISQFLTKNVQGLATSTAKEIEKIYLETINKNQDEDCGKILFNVLNEFVYNSNIKPCVIFKENKVFDVMVYPYEESDKVQYFPTLYEAEEFYFNERERSKNYLNKKERLKSITNTAIKKIKKKITAITAKEKDALSAEDNKLKGELLLANLYRLRQGQKEIELENYYDGTIVKIELNENLSISKNAENYYKKYNKQKRTLEALKPQMEQAEKELNYLNGVLDEIELAESINELLLVQDELESEGLIKIQNHKKTKKDDSFCRVYDVLGYKVLVGRNNAENDKLTFTAKPNDLWVHVKDYHSSHVIIERAEKEVTDKVLLIAGEICAYYSKARESGKVEVVYTERKNVKKPPKSKLGFCIYDNFKSITVCPEKHVEFLKTK